jgi:hypothetical protein
LDFAKSDNIFNTSQKTLENYFIFTQIDTFDSKYYQRIIYLIIKILVLHIHIQPKLISIIKKEEYDTFTIIRDLDVLLSSDPLTNEKSDKFVKLAVEICFHFKFQTDLILYYLYNTFRFEINDGVSHLLTNDCLEKLEYLVNGMKNVSDEIYNINKNEDFMQFFNKIENNSFYDFLKSGVVNYFIIL